MDSIDIVRLLFIWLTRIMWATPKRTGGLRIRGHLAHRDVRNAIVRFARWIRTEYCFPVRCPVYLSPHYRLTMIDGSIVTASFFAPWDSNVEPYIRIATGDYRPPRSRYNRNNVLAGYLHSLAHELVHYWQWVESGDTTERGVIVRAGSIVGAYALTTDNP